MTNKPVKLNSKGKPSKGHGRQNAPYTCGKSRYTTEEKIRGLTALVICGGGVRAAKFLKKQDPPLNADATTLVRWAEETDKELYEEIREKEFPRLRRTLAAMAEETALREGQAELEVLDSLMTDLEEGKLDARDKSNALRNIATSKAIAIDKSNVLRDRPTEIKAHVSINDLADKWGKQGIDIGELFQKAAQARQDEANIVDAEVVDAPELEGAA